jgi:hypothetical protein
MGHIQLVRPEHCILVVQVLVLRRRKGEISLRRKETTKVW